MTLGLCKTSIDTHHKLIISFSSDEHFSEPGATTVLSSIRVQKNIFTVFSPEIEVGSEFTLF